MENSQEKPKQGVITQRVKLLDERLTKVEEQIAKIFEKPEITYSQVPKSDSTSTTVAQGVITQAQPTTLKYPVPMEYREVISSVLNGNFGLTVEPMPDRPAFMLNIIVPEKYSNMSEDEKKMNKVDLRTRIIGYAEGVNGVRQYAELVANNLGPEIRANIIADRALLQ